MDTIDDYTIDQSINRIGRLLNDIRFLSAEREEYGIETIATSAISQLQIIEYIVNEARKGK